MRKCLAFLMAALLVGAPTLTYAQADGSTGGTKNAVTAPVENAPAAEDVDKPRADGALVQTTGTHHSNSTSVPGELQHR